MPLPGLHIRPHPELSWWAMRGQLVDAPGERPTREVLEAFLGGPVSPAALLADMRRLRQVEPIGTFDHPDHWRLLCREPP